MGFFSFLKKAFKVVVKVAATVVGGAFFGPVGAAVGAGLATKLTGGSFQESLISAGTAFIGAHVTQGINAGLPDPISGTAAMAPTGSLIGDFVANNSPGALLDLAQQSVSFGGPALTPTLTSLGLDTLGGVGATAIGGLTGLTLESTVNDALKVPGGAEALLEAGLTQEQINALSEGQRAEQLQTVFEGLLETTTNPGIPDEDFNKILASGLARRSDALPPLATQAQFDASFGLPNLGSSILREEEGLRQEAASAEVANVFGPNLSDLFTGVDDALISKILNERQGPASEAIATFQARGNLNPLGGQTANEALTRQREGADTRLREIASGVNEENLLSAEGIAGRAREAAGGVTLTSPVFDIAPFQTELENLRVGAGNTFERDLRESIGPEKLFNVRGALNEGGATQGLVSGRAPNTALDAIAQRSLEARRKQDRGLGSRGSGVF